MPPDFHLEVLAPQVHQTTIGTHHAEVAGEIEPRLSPVRIRQECRFRQLRLPPVTDGQILAPHDDLPCLVRVHLAAVFIEQEHFFVRHRVAHGDLAVATVPLVADEVPPDAEGLRRTHDVHEHARRGKVALELLDVVAVDGFAAQT